MKRFIPCLLAALILIAFAPPAEATSEVQSLVFADTLTTATGAQTIYSGVININDWNYIGFNVFCDVTTGGNAGAAALSVEGRGRGQSAGWTTIFMVDFGDSLNVVSSIALSSTADLYKHFIITAVPFELKNEAANRDLGAQGVTFGFGNYLPFEVVRITIVDTNWNAGVKFSGNCIKKR